LEAITSPSFTGYCIGYKEECVAQWNAISFWDTFVPKLAELSWRLLIHPGNSLEKAPQWMSILMDSYYALGGFQSFAHVKF